jgi:hypothetical protein
MLEVSFSTCDGAPVLGLAWASVLGAFPSPARSREDRVPVSLHLPTIHNCGGAFPATTGMYMLTIHLLFLDG